MLETSIRLRGQTIKVHSFPHDQIDKSIATMYNLKFTISMREFEGEMGRLTLFMQRVHLRQYVQTNGMITTAQSYVVDKEL